MLAQIPLSSPAHITDLGCGTAHLSAELARRWPEAQVTGIDSSAEMLSRAPTLPNLKVVQTDLQDWTPTELPDLLLSNSALQWAANHPALIPWLAVQVASGGVFAFQVPGIFGHPAICCWLS